MMLLYYIKLCSRVASRQLKVSPLRYSRCHLSSLIVYTIFYPKQVLILTINYHRLTHVLISQVKMFCELLQQTELHVFCSVSAGHTLNHLYSFRPKRTSAEERNTVAVSYTVSSSESIIKAIHVCVRLCSRNSSEPKSRSFKLWQ